MHPEITARKKAEAFAKVFEVAARHGGDDPEFEQLAHSPSGPGVEEVKNAKALAKLAEMVDELYETNSTKKSASSGASKKKQAS
jgi:hypothetical protein